MQEKSAYQTSQTLWAFAILFSFLSSTYNPAKLSLLYLVTDLLPFVFAFLFICSHKPTFLFMLSALSYLGSSFILFPLIPNHRYVLLASTFMLLIPIIKSPKGLVGKYFEDKIISSFVIATAIVYFFAFYTKLNSSYIDENLSCAVVFYKHITSLNNFFFENSIANYFAIYGSIVLEFLLAFFLFSKYKNTAVFFGIIFHFILALDLFKYFTNFSSVMYLLLITSGGKPWLKQFEQSATKILMFLKSDLVPRVLLTLCVLSVWYLSYLSGTSLEDEQARNLNYFVHVRHLLWVAYSIFIFSVAFAVLKKEVVQTERLPFPKLISLESFILFLIIVNGVTPFVGLKSRTGFNMYSNLRIEPGYSNHFMVSKNPDLGGYLSDTGYLIGESGKLVCKSILIENSEYPIFEILRSVNLCPDENFKFKYNDQIFNSNSDEVKVMIKNKTNWLLRKLITFKPIGSMSEKECIW